MLCPLPHYVWTDNRGGDRSIIGAKPPHAFVSGAAQEVNEMKVTRKKLEAAAREFLRQQGYEYEGVSLIDCAESRDPKIYNPRADKAVAAARKILQAAQKRA